MSGLDSSSYSSRLGGKDSSRVSGVDSSSSVVGMDSNLSALDIRLKREQRRLKTRLPKYQYNRDENKELKEENNNDSRLSNGVEDKPIEDQSVDQCASQLEQWIKKIKNPVLEHCLETRFGVYQSNVVAGAPSYEPYPSLNKEQFQYSGGKDRKGVLNGKGTVEFDDGSYIIGTWERGVRNGHCKVETKRNGVTFIDGEYRQDELNGKAKMVFDDNTYLIGYFKDGVLHGFARFFDQKQRLTFLGMHRNGKAFGTCWKKIRGGGCIVGRVCDGKLAGDNIAYLYPDYKTALVGTFNDGVMEFAQPAHLIGVKEEYRIMVPIFSDPKGGMHKRELSTHEFVTSSPKLTDPYESEMVFIKVSSVMGGGEGLFVRKAVEPHTVLCFYNGLRYGPEHPHTQGDWVKNAYKIFDPTPGREKGIIDVIEEYQDTKNYTATLGHKINHSFVPNSFFGVYDHPRYGIIPCIVAEHHIAGGEEVFVRYGYDLDYCPDWYLGAWENGCFAVPDSMKEEYGLCPTSNGDCGDSSPQELNGVENGVESSSAPISTPKLAKHQVTILDNDEMAALSRPDVSHVITKVCKS